MNPKPTYTATAFKGVALLGLGAATHAAVATIAPAAGPSWWQSLLTNLLPMVLPVVIGLLSHSPRPNTPSGY